MAHVLQHVHTCIHYTQYLLQFSPYLILNKTQILYTSTVLPFTSRYYQCCHTLKLVKNTYFTGLPYGVSYHIKLLSLLI